MATNWSQYKEEPDVDWSQYKEDAGPKNSGSTWKSLYKGLSEAYPATLKSGVNAASQLFNGPQFDEQQEQPTENWAETLGRFGGKTAGGATLLAPAAYAGGALLPGVAGAALGAGLGGALTTKGGVKERLTSGALDAAIPYGLKAAGSALRLGRAGLSSVKPRQAADIIQEAHDIAHAKAIKPLNEVAKEAAESNMSPIKLPTWVTKLANEKGVFARTPANKRLLENVKKGDHQSIMDFQSDMFKKARQLSQPTKSAAENNLGEEIEAAREATKDTMQNHYKKEGRPDWAEKVKLGMGEYRGVKELFHDDPVISALVGTKKKVPKNLVEKVSADTAYHEKLRKALPELNKLVKRQKDKETLLHAEKIMKRLGVGAAYAKYLMPNFGEEDKK